MKPFVAIGGVLDNLFLRRVMAFPLTIVPKTETLYTAYEAVLESA